MQPLCKCRRLLHLAAGYASECVAPSVLLPCDACSTFDIPFSRSASYDDNLSFFKEVLAELHRWAAPACAATAAAVAAAALKAAPQTATSVAAALEAAAAAAAAATERWQLTV